MTALALSIAAVLIAALGWDIARRWLARDAAIDRKRLALIDEHAERLRKLESEIEAHRLRLKRGT